MGPFSLLVCLWGREGLPDGFDQVGGVGGAWQSLRLCACNVAHSACWPQELVMPAKRAAKRPRSNAPKSRDSGRGTKRSRSGA